MITTTPHQRDLKWNKAVSQNGFWQKGSEVCWFCVTLLLFLLLGPFSAPIVVLVVVRLGIKEPPLREPEALESIYQ